MASINDWTYVSDAWTRDWLARDTELVEKYKPEIVYFDWWIGQPTFRRAVTNSPPSTTTSPRPTATPASSTSRITRSTGRPACATSSAASRTTSSPTTGRPTPPSATHRWGYIEHDTFKSPEFLVHQLIDIVSKNGNLLLNFGPRSDGTIPDEVRTTLLEMGAWLKVNGEAIYGTTPWKTFGEGPDPGERRSISRHGCQSPTPLRISASPPKGSTVYAIGMACPADGKASIHALGTAHEGASISIANVRIARLRRQGHLDAGRRRARRNPAIERRMQVCVHAEADRRCKVKRLISIRPWRYSCLGVLSCA